MPTPFTTTDVLDAILGQCGMSSTDTNMADVSARWSSAASQISSLINCERSPLECYKQMYDHVHASPCADEAGSALCEGCKQTVQQYFLLGSCGHKLCEGCTRGMFDALNDECIICHEPIRVLSFHSCSSMGVPVATPDTTTAPVKSVLPSAEPVKELPCPVFTDMLTWNNLAPGTPAMVYGFTKYHQINLLDDRYISRPPQGQTKIPEENLLYIRDYMKILFLHYFEEVSAQESLSCDWKGEDVSEHKLECYLRDDVCKNKELGCTFAAPHCILEYHGCNYENICLYEHQACPLCNERVINRDLYEHEVACSQKLVAEHKEKLRREYEEYVAKPQKDKVPEGQGAAEQAAKDADADAQDAERSASHYDADTQGISVKDVCEGAKLLGEVYCDLVTANPADMYSSTSSAVNSSVDIKTGSSTAQEITELVMGEQAKPTESPKQRRGSSRPKVQKVSEDGKKGTPKREHKEYKGKDKTDARVRSYEVATSGTGHPFIVYTIELPSIDGGEPIVIKKRMNEIKTMHKKLQYKFPSLRLPKLPQDKPWALGGNKLSFVTERIRQLEQYCGELNKITMVHKSTLYKEYVREQCAHTVIDYHLKE